MTSEQDLTANIKRLEAIKAKGILETRYQGELIRYRSVSELNSAINDFKRQLDRLRSGERSPVRRRQVNFSRDY